MPEMSESELSEKLKNMSPEELKEFQKKQCIFCQIIAGKVPARIIYKDEFLTAVLDINPANKGHILLLTNEHYPIMPIIPDDVVAKLASGAKHLSDSILKGFKSDGTTIFAANGGAAGQKAQHFMMHIIPRFPDDWISFDYEKKKLSDKDLAYLRKAFAPKIKASLGYEISATPDKHEAFEEKKPQVKNADVPKKEKAPKEKKKDEEADLDDISKLLSGGI